MAVGDAYVFPGFLTPVLTELFFQSHRLLFSHASAKVTGDNTPEGKVASTGDRTHNHQVMSPTRSPLGHPGFIWLERLCTHILAWKNSMGECNTILSAYTSLLQSQAIKCSMSQVYLFHVLVMEMRLCKKDHTGLMIVPRNIRTCTADVCSCL